MEKTEFLRILAEGGGKDNAGRTSWVAMLADLQKREEPFTKVEIAEEYGANPKYVYSHLNDWRKEGKLAVINFGGSNVYMATDQVPKEE